MKCKRIAAAVLAVVLAASLTACASENVKWIATQDGKNIPAGIYLTYMVDAYYEANSLVEPQEGTKLLDKQVEGKPATEWILDKANQSLQRYIAIDQAFEKQALAGDPEELAMMQAQVQAQWQYMGALYQQNGISAESYMAVMESSYKEGQLFKAIYGPEGSSPVPSTEVVDAFRSGYYQMTTISESLTSSVGDLTEEEQTALTTRLQKLVDDANVAGANFQDLILAYEKEKAKTEGAEESSVHAHDANSHTSFLTTDSTAYSDEFMKAISEMKNGEVRLLTEGKTLYVVQKMENTAELDGITNYYDTVLYKLKGDAFKEVADGWTNQVTVQYNEEAKNLYQPSKLKFEE